MAGNDIKSPQEDAAIEWAAEARIAKAGIRVSRERVRALGLLMKFDDRAWTVHELARLSAREGVEPAAMTRLYRSLHLLEEKGIVEREVHRTPGRASLPSGSRGRSAPYGFNAGFAIVWSQRKAPSCAPKWRRPAWKQAWLCRLAKSRCSLHAVNAENASPDRRQVRGLFRLRWPVGNTTMFVADSEHPVSLQ